jgi:hypothetical protein
LLASVNDTAYRNNPHAAEELKQDIWAFVTLLTVVDSRNACCHSG